MTLAELEAATARLGFTPSLDDGGELLRDAALRAINEVALARPRITRATLWHYPDIPVYSETNTEAETDERVITVGGGTAFHMRIIGNGRLHVERGTYRNEYVFSAAEGTSPAIIGGLIPRGEGTLTFRFAASEPRRLLSFAVYEGAYAGMPPDPTRPKEYYLPYIFQDFGALVGPLMSEEGEQLREGQGEDYTLRDNSTVAINRATPCRIELTYRRALKLPLSGDLPVTEEEAALLPLFCAAYVFLDDDPEKATFYLARFSEGLRRLSQESAAPMRYRDTTGWG